MTFWIQEKGILVPSEYKPTLNNLVFDFDGVITQPQELKAEILKEYGYTILPEQTSRKKAQTLMLEQKPGKGKAGVREDYMNMINVLYVHRMDEVPPEKDAIDVLHRLKYSGFSNYILTSRDSSEKNPEVQAANKWLNHYDLEFKGIISTNNQGKEGHLKIIRPKIFVDDSLGKIAAVFENEACTDLDPLLYDTQFLLFYQTANSDVKPRGIIDSVRNWKELEKLIVNI